MEEDQELRSLKRGLKALALLNQVEMIGISELARKLDLPRTTAERILVTLATEGYVQRLHGEKRYRLAPKVCALARGFSDESWITHVATPHLFETTARIGWPLAVVAPRGEKMALRVTSDPATPLWLARRRVGAEYPMLGVSSGLVFLAFATAPQREALIELFRTSDHAANAELVADQAGLEAQLETVRRQGFAFGEAGGEGSVSLPIVIGGEVKAVLLMIYMARALSDAVVIRDFVPQLLELAQTIGVEAEASLDVEAT